MKNKNQLIVSIFFIVFLITIGAFSQETQSKDTTLIEFNLKLDKNKLHITVFPPKINTKEIHFIIPQIIPGTYLEVNYKRFYSKFKAFTKDGHLLSTHRKGNHVIIKNATQLYKLEYQVKQSQGDKRIWDNIIGCAGTIFSKQSYLINYQLITGYFERFKNTPFQVRVKKPKQLFGSTALHKSIQSKTVDWYASKNYAELIDSPLLYAKADTTSFYVGNSKFDISVYSQTGHTTSKKVKPALKKIITSIKAYYGNLPTKTYHFIFYCVDFNNLNFFDSFGIDSALEHLHSSVYYLSDDQEKGFISYLNYIATHEYLHTFTPLTIRSEKISDFNFDKPNMSQHLWFYEGLTDYTALLINKRYGISKQFKSNLNSNLSFSKNHKLRSLTESSKAIISHNIFEFPSKIMQLINFYSKGGLVSFGLDMELYKLSRGKMRLRDLILALQKDYNFNTPFSESDFFDALVQKSYPEIRLYIDTYIIGKKNIPYKSYFKLLGWYYVPKGKQIPCFGNFDLYNKDSTGIIYKSDKHSLFKQGDVVVGINGVMLDDTNFKKRILLLIKPLQNEKIIVTVKRADKIVTINAIANKLRKTKYGRIYSFRTLSQTQKAFQNRFINGEL